jgi:hypothetical protein
VGTVVVYMLTLSMHSQVKFVVLETLFPEGLPKWVDDANALRGLRYLQLVKAVCSCNPLTRGRVRYNLTHRGGQGSEIMIPTGDIERVS